MVARKYIWPGPATSQRAVVRLVASDEALKGELGVTLGQLGYVVETEEIGSEAGVPSFPAISSRSEESRPSIAAARARLSSPVAPSGVAPAPESTEPTEAPLAGAQAPRRPPPLRVRQQPEPAPLLAGGTARMFDPGATPPVPAAGFASTPSPTTTPMQMAPDPWEEPTPVRAPTPQSSAHSVDLPESPRTEASTAGTLPWQEDVDTWSRAFATLSIVAAFVVQRAFVFRSYFVDDDYLHLFDVSLLRPRDFLLMPVVPHASFSLNALFAALHALFGVNVTRYFIFGLLLHCTNTALLYTTARRLTGSAVASSLAAGLWGMSLMGVGTLSWVSIYGQVIATSCALWILRDVVGYANSRKPPRASTYFGWTVLATIGASGFATGVAFAVCLPFVVWLLLPAECRPRRTALTTLACMVVPVAAWLIQIIGRLLSADVAGTIPAFPGVDGGAQGAFTGLVMVGVPILTHFLALGTASLIGGPLLVIEKAESAVPVIIASYVVLAFCVLAAIFGLRVGSSELRRRVAALALAVWGTYGFVALGKGLTSHGDPFHRVVGIATETRYHYLPQALLVLVFAVALTSLAQRLRLSGWKARAPAVAFLGALLAVNATTNKKPFNRTAELRREDVEHRFQEWERYIGSVREGSTVYIHNANFRGLSSLLRSGYTPTRLPHVAGLFATKYGTDTVRGRTVRFVEPDPEIVQHYRQRALQPMAKLLVTTAEATAAHAVVLGQARNDRVAGDEAASANAANLAESNLKARMREARRRREAMEAAQGPNPPPAGLPQPAAPLMPQVPTPLVPQAPAPLMPRPQASVPSSPRLPAPPLSTRTAPAPAPAK